MTSRFPDLDALLTTAEAAQAVGVNAHTVRKWRTRGWLSPDGERRQLSVAGHNDAGWPLHRYRDVLDAERETATTPVPHRPRQEAMNLPTARLAPVDWAALNRAS